MKLDIEGAEMAALPGAHGLLAGRSIRYLLCELNDNRLRRYADLSAFCAGLGAPARSFAAVLFRHRPCAGAPPA